jgi:hypothetical protein
MVVVSHLKPAGQVSQVSEPSAEYLPRPQGVLSTEPSAHELPAGQVVQVVAAALGPGPSVLSASAYVPAGHGRWVELPSKQ